MTRRGVDLDELRTAIRRMKRGDLLMVAERAIELVPKAKLQALVGDMVHLNKLEKKKTGAAPLLDEVRKFHTASLVGEYYEDFAVNSKNSIEQSEGTDAFIAEFNRLLVKCIRAALNARRLKKPVREAFDLLFALLRRLDCEPDDVVFFADEGGAWQVGVDWRSTLPAYFQCLAEEATPEEFAREVDRVIEDFSEYDRAKHLTAARRVASAEQKAALRRLSTGKGSSVS
jgi:hypothetical protein